MKYSYDRTSPDYDRRKVALDIGRGTFTEHLKLHRFHGSLRITDMENAGKRGKKVRELTVIAKTNDDALEDKILKQAASSILHMKYDQAKSHLESILERDDHGSLFELHEVVYRGVDVEPMGTTLQLEKKFPDGSIVKIESSPHDFMVKSSTPINAPNKPAHGMYQDTSYWPAKKQDGIIFYGWLKDNLAAAGNMTIQDLFKVWADLGVRYNSH